MLLKSGSAGSSRRTLRIVGGYAAAALSVLAASAILWAVRPLFNTAHASLPYLLVVALVAYAAGAGPAVLGAFLSFVSWNYLFLEPRGAFWVYDPGDVIALLTFLVVAVLIGELAGRAREQAVAARERERETAMLYDISMASAANAGTTEVVARVLERVVRETRAAGGAVLLPGTGPSPEVAGAYPTSNPDRLDARWREHTAEVLRTGVPWGWDPPGDDGPVYLPLQTGNHIAGTLLIAPGGSPAALSWQSRRLLLAAASHLVIAIERERLSREAAQAEALRAAEQFRSTLLSSVSHDLRTPLASIKAAVTSLLHSEQAHSPSARRELLTAVNEETDRLNAFVGNLLDLSRLEAGAWRPQKEWFDLAEVIGTVLRRLDVASEARVRLHLPPELPLAPVDCIQIGQALWNVLENALKFSPPDQPVAVEARRTRGDRVRITVSDCGPGIPAGEEEQIFGKFYRALGDRRAAGVPGAGLGLAIARGIVDAHGGEIHALNRPGGGTTVEILLPLRPPDIEAPKQICGEERREEEEATGGR